jgi:hypothetical protein
MELPSSVLSVEVVRNLREGDLVWVVVSADATEEDVEDAHGVVGSVLPDGVNLMVTHSDYVQRVRVASLTDLLHLQETIEAAIRAMADARALET